MFDMIFKGIITQINNDIGASGIVIRECKIVVSQYGNVIMELLMAYVCLSFIKAYMNHSKKMTHLRLHL